MDFEQKKTPSRCGGHAFAFEFREYSSQWSFPEGLIRLQSVAQSDALLEYLPVTRPKLEDSRTAGCLRLSPGD
jgi:hypothetical protein